MSDPAETPRPSQLWKQLSAERKTMAAEAFWQDENAGVEQAEAMALIAQRIKFRLKSVQAMPLDKKIRRIVPLAGLSEGIAARLLVSYHLAHQRPMMVRFLDALAIAHEDGLIAEEELTAPPADTLKAAARGLAAEFPAEDVSLYLSTLIWQDPDTWGGLADLPEVRSGSQATSPQRT